MTEIITEIEQAVHPAAVPSVPVTLAGPVSVALLAAEFGAYFSLTLTGTEQAQKILPYDKHRYQAFISVSYDVPQTGATPYGVWVGAEAQVKATPALGFLLETGILLPVCHRQPVWIVGTGTPAVVNVSVARHEPGES